MSSTNKLQKALPVSNVEDSTELESSVAQAEWPEEQRSCTRRKRTAVDGAESNQHWVEDNAHCILNAVTIAGAG